MTTRRTYLIWAVTRIAMLSMLPFAAVGWKRLYGDIGHYRVWAEGIAHWTRVPYRDFGWEYPPGATAVMTPPVLFGHLYRKAFIALMVGVDLGVLVALRRLAARLGSQRGVLLWLGCVALLGPMAFTRYDSVASLLAILTLSAVAAGAPLLAGVLLGGGVVVKLWPVVLLVAVPFVTGRRRLLLGAGAVLAATVLAVLAIGGARHGTETLTRHTNRGLQVESIVATPLVVAERAGSPIDISFYETSGSWDMTGPGVAGALAAAKVLTVVAVAAVAVLVARTRRRPDLYADLAFTALLLLTVSEKVLSPQYELWLFGLLAAALCRRGSPLGPVALLVAATAPLTQLVYPVYYRDLVNGQGLLVVVALVARNALLVAAAVTAVTLLWRATRRSATP